MEVRFVGYWFGWMEEEGERELVMDREGFGYTYSALGTAAHIVRLSGDVGWISEEDGGDDCD